MQSIPESAIARLLHDTWRREEQEKNLPASAYVRATRDEQWITDHKTGSVNLLETEYPNLPGDLQSEYKMSAAAIHATLSQEGVAIDLHDASTKQRIGQAMHDHWLAHHPWAKNGVLDTPFEGLPQDIQEVYLRNVRTVLDYMS